MSLSLRDIGPDNWREINSLSVGDEDRQFVASNVSILARAFVYRKNNSKAYAIYLDELAIGLIMQRDYEYNGRINCILDQFMIDRNYQAKGYGREAMKIWMASIIEDSRYDAIELSYIEGAKIAENLYSSLGFIRDRLRDDGDELSMVYYL